LLDVDHLKAYNDRWGRAQGDTLIRHIAMLLGSSVDPGMSRARGRTPEVACRYGGGELALLLVDADLEATRSRAEAFRKAIQSHAFAGREGQPGRVVSVSIGVAAFPQCASRQEQLVESAERALRQAKLAGRNRVEFARPIRFD
jgi:diguanylate cyclase (GGDEF)-like protein